MSVAVDIARLAENMKRSGVPADYGPDLFCITFRSITRRLLLN
jgi:hypothetical protein